jgi:putative chitinase
MPEPSQNASFFNIADIEAVDFPKLISKLPGKVVWNPFSVQAQYIRAILESYSLFKDYEINTAQRLSHFLAQGLIETGFLAAKVENLNYSAAGLRRIWPSRFPSDEVANAYARKPEKIANYVYANRMGNGDEASGDGWRYRGRGFFQLTGKDNYKRFGDMAGIDLVGDPEALEKDLKLSLKVAMAFFQKQGLNAFADRNDASAISRAINIGNAKSSKPAHGEADRIAWTANVLQLVKAPESIVKPGAPVAPSPGPAPPASSDPAAPPAPASTDLAIGATGPAVRRVQRLLNTLGYFSGIDDGVFGPETRRAVLAFQDEHDLKPANGIVDARTQAAMEAALDDRVIVPAPPGAPPTAPPQTEAQKPQPKAAPAPPAEKPLSQSRTIWGAILAGLAGIAQFLTTQFSAFAAAFPIIQTSIGPINTVWILVAVLLFGLGMVIFARIDDRRRGRR